MVDQSDDRAASAPINEQQSAFHFEHRERDQSKEIAAGPGLHALSGTRYVPELKRVADTQEIMDASLRECKDPWQVKKHGVCPFRQREMHKEIQTPMMYSDTTQPERIKSTLLDRGLASPAWTDTGQDLTRVGSHGYDHVPVGMRRNEVCVRGKPKAPSHLQFKLSGCPPRALAKQTSWVQSNYEDAAEGSGYGIRNPSSTCGHPNQDKYHPKYGSLPLHQLVPPWVKFHPSGETESNKVDEEAQQKHTLEPPAI